jgi:carboxypeptidase PM20D1
MEAVEMLLAGGFKPRQTIYLVMGQDEEVMGQRGSKAVAELLKSRGVKLDFVIDEGPLVSEGIIAGVDKPVAVVGLAEKGYASFQLSLDTAPGHSSMPPPRTAIGTMAAAVARIEDHPLPGALAGVAASMFETLAPEMPLVNRVLLSNLWLFRPLVMTQLVKAPSTNAMLRTTTALTIFNAGNKDNVLPGHAEATVNFRLIPGDSLAAIQAHLKSVLGNEAIQVRAQDGNAEPSAVSPMDSAGYLAINRSVREVFADAIVVPGLMSAGTDSRHFSLICDNIYRFSPVRARTEDLPRFHGTNERISVTNYTEMIQFYYQLMRNLAGSPSAV